MSEDGAAIFADHRGLLFTIAYELLASTADAEDAVQDTWLRWQEVDPATVDHPRAYLARIVTRVSLNRLRTLQRRREQYVGPWLPEPLLTVPDVADDVELADAVSFALLVVLESLPPVERAVFVLREVFGFAHEEIAEAVGRSPAAVRQLAHRAREHVQARRPSRPVEPSVHAEVLQRFLAAADGGDLGALLDLLAPDVVLLSDGGGVVRAALRPVVGAEKVARLMVALAEQARALDAVSMEPATVNGSPAAVFRAGGRVDTVLAVTVHDGRVGGIQLIRNPEKLADLRPHVVAR